MEGDKLAKGGKSAQFPPADVTQEKWDAKRKYFPPCEHKFIVLYS
jgi:hypothetical protein